MSTDTPKGSRYCDAAAGPCSCGEWHDGTQDRPRLGCARCGGPVTPGVDGFFRGVSREHDGSPAGLVFETVIALHYTDRCPATTPTEER